MCIYIYAYKYTFVFKCIYMYMYIYIKVYISMYRGLSRKYVVNLKNYNPILNEIESKMWTLINLEKSSTKYFSKCFRYEPKVLLQGGEHALDALSCRSFFAKEPLKIGLFCVKWPAKIRHLINLRYPVQPIAFGVSVNLNLQFRSQSLISISMVAFERNVAKET